MNKINKEFSQLSGEELFKPITKRLDKAAKEPEPAEEPAGPNYEMDEFDRLNPFDDEFRPDAETPPSPPPPPPPSPSAEEEEEEEEEEEAVPSQETTSRKKAWKAPVVTPFLKGPSESVVLGTAKSMRTKYRNDPDRRIDSGMFEGMLIKELDEVISDIEWRRGVPPTQRAPLEWRRGVPPTQPAQSPLDDASWERETEGSGLGKTDASWERETEGSGLGKTDAEKLINQLYVSLGSIRAGNTSKKLRKQVVDLLQLLIKHGVINEFLRKKIVDDYIAP